MTKPIVPLKVLAEERKFFREHFGMRDPEIARRLGIRWSTYQAILRRHPELDTLFEPEPKEHHA